MSATVFAAGAVCWRLVDGVPHVLLIHRDSHGDVSLPKGKVDPGETLPETAVREVSEETGLSLALGAPLGTVEYALPSGRGKHVTYWAAFADAAAIRASTFIPNREVSALEWLPLAKAKKKASYRHDVRIIEAFETLWDDGVGETFALVALRHAKAVPGGDWDGDDHSRILTARGQHQAEDLVDSVLAFGVERIVASDAVRCESTVAPLAARLGRAAKLTPELSQRRYEDGTADVRSVVGKRVRARRNAVLCSHAPVLPEILREIALATGSLQGKYIREGAMLQPSGFCVVHLSVSNPASGIIAVEAHQPPLLARVNRS